MIRDITFGQFYPAQSPIHRLDPRVKIVCTLLFLISLFIQRSILGYAIATLFLALVILFSKVPLKYILKGLRPVILLLLITVSFNLFLTRGEELLVQFGFIRIYKAGLTTAVFMGIRLMYLILGSSIMTFTTTPNALTDGLESLLKPLERIRVPVHEVAMMMSIALRFIPILLEETDKIMKAQIARGADLDSGNVFQRVKGMVPILVPLFVSAFRRANDLALAMEARCYHGSEGRTKMKPLYYRRRDYLAYGKMVLYLGAMIVFGHFVDFDV
ncbi:MAG: energy-coupling factor transporter transmembrane protein EcfT [Lachnospiraceae bacterium]|nr:energy-coupling factor transporter transmembrane protein EcfT [Lachnospiraceae bacterium]